MFDAGLVVPLVASLAASISGHRQAHEVSEQQPAKLAAFEGQYEAGSGDLYLFGIPNDETESVDDSLSVPGGLSFLLYGDFSKPVTGLDPFEEKNQPPVQIPFQAYPLMVSGSSLSGSPCWPPFCAGEGSCLSRRGRCGSSSLPSSAPTSPTRPAGWPSSVDPAYSVDMSNAASSPRPIIDSAAPRRGTARP